MSMNSTRRRFMARAAAGIGLVARARASAPEAQRRTASTEFTDAQLVEELVAANRILAQQGIVDTFGHVSVRLTVAAAGAHVQTGEVAPRPRGLRADQ
jgi:multisubunit Na+/H+ antiporter MnhB subunit